MLNASMPFYYDGCNVLYTHIFSKKLVNKVDLNAKTQKYNRLINTCLALVFNKFSLHTKHIF